jgi:hypothetical protein
MNVASENIRGERKSGTVVGVAGWLGSSVLGLAGTVLLICWLLAEVLEPAGEFARVGLVLAVVAYGMDLVREEWSAGRERGAGSLGMKGSTTTKP